MGRYISRINTLFRGNIYSLLKPCALYYRFIVHGNDGETYQPAMNRFEKKEKFMFNRVWKPQRRICVALLLLAFTVTHPALAAKKIEWMESIDKGMAEAKKTGKPIMMDFYTEW